MKIYVLASPGTMESGARLGFPAYAGTNGLGRVATARDLIIRWGNSEGPRFPYEINNRDAIALCVDKPRCHRILDEVVRVPKMYEYRVPAGEEVVQRPRNHTRGEGFQIRTGAFRVPEGHYCTKRIQSSTEFRVWFAFDKRLAANRTRRVVGDIDSSACRSQWNYSFREMPRGLGDKITECQEATGMHTGAVDVLYAEEENKYYVLEVNSAPALDHYRLCRFFSGAIREKLGINDYTINTSVLRALSERATADDRVV